MGYPLPDQLQLPGIEAGLCVATHYVPHPQPIMHITCGKLLQAVNGTFSTVHPLICAPLPYTDTNMRHLLRSSRVCLVSVFSIKLNSANGGLIHTYPMIHLSLAQGFLS